MSRYISIIGINGSGKSLVTLVLADLPVSEFELSTTYQSEVIFGHGHLPLIFGGWAINYISPSGAVPGDTTASTFVTNLKSLYNLIHVIGLSNRISKQLPLFLTASEKPALITFCQSLKPILSVANNQGQSCIPHHAILLPGFNNDECSA
jgi:hypothetical protein